MDNHHPQIRQVSFDKAKKITVGEVHPHELFLATYLEGQRCDVCQCIDIQTGYHCPDCDFDYCMQCFNTKNVKILSQPSHSIEYIRDFINKPVETKVDTDYYNSIMYMIFTMENEQRANWSLTATSIDGKIQIVLPIDRQNTNCVCQNCNMHLSVTPKELINMSCEYTNSEDYTLVQMKHLNDIMHLLFPDDFVMILKNNVFI